MEALSFRNNYIQSQPENVQKRLESNENFTALDTEKLKQDTVEIASKAKENANENFIFRTLRNFGVDDPKKTLKSLAFSVITVIIVGILGNKFSKPAARLGNTIDEFLTGNNFIGKIRNKVADILQKGVDILKKAPKPKFIVNAQNALKNPVKQKWNLFRGFENGAKGLFSNTITETIQQAIEKNKTSAMETLKNVLGDNEELAKKLVENMKDTPNVKFADNLLNEIAKANNCTLGSKEFEQVLEKLSNGEFGDGLRFVKMNKGGLTGSWWPVNFINDISNKFFHKNIQSMQGDLGDSLLKYAAIRGKLGKTLPSKLVQIVPPLVGDQISNFVNDKSGFGVLLCANLIGNYNKLQDAPKEKKITTAVNDAATGSLSWLISMPVSYGITYSLASLSKMEGKDILSRLTRTIGKVFALGLNQPGKLGGVKGVVGGIGRFIAILFVFSPLVGKQIDKLCAKIFGKPYDPAEVEKQKQLEEQKNTIVPELGITQGELQQRIEKNPDAIKKMQQDPELVKAIDKNPKLLLDLLDNKEINLEEAPKTQTVSQSPLLQNMLNNNKPVSNQADLFGTKTKEKTSQNEKPKDTATYIPSSQFSAPRQELSTEAQQEYSRLMARADKALKNAEKYI